MFNPPPLHQPARHPLLRRRSSWLLAGYSTSWLDEARRFAGLGHGPLMSWRLAEGLLQVVQADRLGDMVLAMLTLQPAEFTLVCEPGRLRQTMQQLDRVLPNLMTIPPRDTIRVSEQTAPFSALVPRLQLPEPELAQGWFQNRRLPWSALATQAWPDGSQRPLQGINSHDPAPERAKAAERALNDWAEAFAAQFSPGELDEVYGHLPLGTLDGTAMPQVDQPQPAPWKPRFVPGELPGAPRAGGDKGTAMALAAAAGASAAAGEAWRASGRWPTSSSSHGAAELGHFALSLDGQDLSAELWLDPRAAQPALQDGQAIALVLQAESGLSLRLRGQLRPATSPDGGGMLQAVLQRTLDESATAQLRALRPGQLTVRPWYQLGGGV